jgi:hypothetical protein
VTSASGPEQPAETEFVPRPTGKPVLTPEEARNWRLAKLFDLRSFIGALLLIFGVLVIIPGFVAGKATIDKSAGINLELWVGGLMLVIGAFFVIWILLRPPPPVTMAEMEAARKAREEFGTQGPPPGH